jgi:hypothetical protein
VRSGDDAARVRWQFLDEDLPQASDVYLLVVVWMLPLFFYFVGSGSSPRNLLK